MSPPAASCFVRLAASSRHASRPADPQSTPISPFKSLFRNSNRTPAATEPLRPAQRGSGRMGVALGGVSRVGGDVVTARPHTPRHLAVVRKRLATSLPRRRETGNKYQPLTCRRHPDLTYTRSPIRIGRLFFLDEARRIYGSTAAETEFAPGEHDGAAFEWWLDDCILRGILLFYADGTVGSAQTWAAVADYRKIAASERADPLVRGYAEHSLCVFYNVTARFGLAIELAERASANFAASGYGRMLVAIQRGHVAMARGEVAASRSYYTTAMRVSLLVDAQRTGDAECFWRREGLPEDARACLDLDGQTWREMEALGCAWLRLTIACERFDEAHAFARELRAAAQARGLRRTLMRALALSVVLEARAGHPAAADAQLVEFLELFVDRGTADQLTATVDTTADSSRRRSTCRRSFTVLSPPPVSPIVQGSCRASGRVSSTRPRSSPLRPLPHSALVSGLPRTV